MKDHVEIDHLAEYDAFRANRDQIMDLETWLKIHTNVLTLTRKVRLEQAKQRNNVWGEQGRGPGWTLPFITLPYNVQCMYN